MKNKLKFSALGLTIILTTMLFLTGCQNTVEGFGRDMDRITHSR